MSARSLVVFFSHRSFHLKNTAKTQRECSSARTDLPLSAGSAVGSAAKPTSRLPSSCSQRAISRCIPAVSSREIMLLPPPALATPPLGLLSLLLGLPPRVVMAVAVSTGDCWAGLRLGSPPVRVSSGRGSVQARRRRRTEDGGGGVTFGVFAHFLYSW